MEIYLLFGGLISIFLGTTISYIEVAYSFLLLIPITFLFSMHIYFGIKGISTYEYILS